MFRALSSRGDYHGEMNHKMIVRLAGRQIDSIPASQMCIGDGQGHLSQCASRQMSCQGNQETPDTRVVDQAGTVSNDPLVC